jgi:hypothetical protein
MDQGNWKQGRNSTKTRVIQSIIGALLFYFTLYVVSKWFPIMTGHSMQSDWAVILIASVPLIIALTYMVTDLFPVIKAKVGDVEVTLEKSIHYDAGDEMVRFQFRLQDRFFEKGPFEDLKQQIEALKKRNITPDILVVPLSGSMHTTFPALKQYVHGLSQIASMRFIVFVDMNKSYMGFMPIDKFMAKYPRTSLETILDDMINDERSGDYWARTFQLQNITTAQLQRDLKELVDRQWMEENQNQRLENEYRGEYIDTDYDVIKLGGLKARIYKETRPGAAYNLMREHAVNGLPVVDAQEKFVGMLMKEDLLDQLIEGLLAHV